MCNTNTLSSQALCRVSKRLRQRSLPPPPPTPKYEFSLPRPSAYTTVGKPAPAPRVVASDYYKKYIKSVYEREPMFKVRWGRATGWPNVILPGYAQISLIFVYHGVAMCKFNL